MAKPADLPIWATDGGADVTEPSLAKKQLGWVASERPPAQFFNWYMEKVHDWCAYLANLDAETAFLGASYSWTGGHTFTSGVTFDAASGPFTVAFDGSANLITLSLDNTALNLKNLTATVFGGAEFANVNVDGGICIREDGRFRVETDGEFDSEESLYLNGSADIRYGTTAAPADRVRTTLINPVDGMLNDDGDWNIVCSAGFFSIKAVSPGSVYVPINLPNGATLTQVRANLQPNGTAVGNIKVFRITPDFGTPASSACVQVGTTQTTSGSGIQTLTISGLSETFANSASQYVLVVEATTAAISPNDFEFESAEITWDDPGPRNH